MSELSTVRIRTNDGGRLLGGLDFCFYLTLIGTNKNFWEDAQNVADESLGRVGGQSLVTRGEKRWEEGHDHRQVAPGIWGTWDCTGGYTDLYVKPLI